MPVVLSFDISGAPSRDRKGANRRIPHAYYLDDWNFESGDKTHLIEDGTWIAPSEYEATMDSCIFCPACYTNLVRVPKEKYHFSNGREAYFAHLKSYKHIKCNLRSARSEGKRYETFEEARNAIDDDNLVIVSGFIEDRPVLPTERDDAFSETPIEDSNGPATDVPIGRHSGGSYRLPSKICTVRGICRNFQENYYKYYYFPGQQHAKLLSDLLFDVRGVTEIDESEKLYYGVIERSWTLGNPSITRMTKLRSNPAIRDFYFKESDHAAQEKRDS